jgi:hypothetical protein
MILWQDFIIDDFWGPTLQAASDSAGSDRPIQVCRRKRQLERTTCIEEDAQGALIQETGLGHLPARMVGGPCLDSFERTHALPVTDKDVRRGARGQLARPGGER